VKPIYKHIYICTYGLQIPFSRWGELYRRLYEEDYANVIPPSDPQMRNVDELVFINIRKSHLHYVATRTLIMPCSKDLDWIIYHTYVKHRTVLNDGGRCIGSTNP
jgi:hypothetical protein